MYLITFIIEPNIDVKKNERHKGVPLKRDMFTNGNGKIMKSGNFLNIFTHVTRNRRTNIYKGLISAVIKSAKMSLSHELNSY